jgi:hypothetical protein
MTATAVVLEVPQRVTTPRRVVGALSRLEALRIVRHPAFLLGLLGTVYTLLQERGADMQQYWMLSGQAFATLGATTFLAGFLNASRVSRDRAGELYAALPGSDATRTGAILLSLSAAAGVATVVTVIAWLLAVGPDGRVVIELETLTPSLLEPAQVPLIVMAFGALGVCFGRWTPQPILAPLLTIVVWVGPIAWSIPWVSMETVPSLPYDSDWVVGSAAWHLVFLAGVIAAASALALLRDVRRPEPVLVAAGGALAVVLGLTLG